MKNVLLNDRDIKILQEISRWKYCLGRQIRLIASFTGERSCDRRLRKLIDAGYLERKHILYGVPGLYFLTPQTKRLVGIKYYSNKIKLGEVMHDLAVIDTVIFLCSRYELTMEVFRSERELHSLDGFSNRKHQPDATFTLNNVRYCLEVEFSEKSKVRFHTNVKDNFQNYDKQIWVIPKNETKIKQMLIDTKFPDIEMMEWETIKNARQ